MAITFPFSIPKFENRIKQGSLTPKSASEGPIARTTTAASRPPSGPYNEATNHHIRFRPEKATRDDVT